VSEIVTKM